MPKRKHGSLFRAILIALALCILSGCNPGTPTNPTTDAETTGETEMEQTTEINETSDLNETTSEIDEDTTESSDGNENEEFKPDPTKAVPEYVELMSNLDSFPIYFKYGSTTYNGFKNFVIESENYKALERGIETTLILRHASISADFKLIATVYPEEKAYEYVVYITNDGDTDTDVFSNLRFDLKFVGADPVLKGIKGDAHGFNYAPYEHKFADDGTYTDLSVTGRPTHGTFPYYNLSYGNSGKFIAVGWPGTWKAEYVYRETNETLTLRAGQRQVSTYIKPGETLRTPLMAFVEYDNLSADEQTNAWRHYYINDVMRKIDGELTPTYAGVANMSEGMTTETELALLNTYKNHGIPFDLIWMDAGWYTGANADDKVPWPKTGSLDIDYSRFPDGMAGIGEFAEENDAMFLLWFEPENMRLDTDAFLAGHPDFKEEWLLGEVDSESWLKSRIINLGNPECREWIFNKICAVIDSSGATGYRQDFNNNPANAWVANDRLSQNRTGMTENQYVQGYLALWDGLIEKYGFLLDSCASGGGRNDLESMKRAVPLHVTDWFDGNNEDYDMKGKINQALFAWFPYYKNECYQTGLYQLRMNYSPFSLLKSSNYTAMTDADWAVLKQAYEEFDVIRDYFYGEYYALTEWSSDTNRWDARMFIDGETDKGFLTVACQAESDTLTNTIRLKGLDADKTYTVKDFDGLVNVTKTGAELMSAGIEITVPEKPYCSILLINIEP